MVGGSTSPQTAVEAKWAIFFDTLTIPYEYEPQDFVLGDLGRYLPDFRLPKMGTWLAQDGHFVWGERDVWVEIKNDFPNIEERSKAQALANQTGQDVWIFKGSEFKPPWLDPTAPKEKMDKHFRGTLYYAFHPEVTSVELSTLQVPDQWAVLYQALLATLSQWRECPVCGDIYLHFDAATIQHLCEDQVTSAIHKALERIGVEDAWKRTKAIINNEALRPASNTPKLLEAYDKARQARFEHGESGPPR
jgi:hypothetical protein